MFTTQGSSRTATASVCRQTHILIFCGFLAAFCFFADSCGEKTHYKRKTAEKAVFQGHMGGIGGNNNRLPPVADTRRALWRRGQRKSALQADIFFGHRKSRECSPKILIFERTAFPMGSVSTSSTRSVSSRSATALCLNFHFNPKHGVITQLLPVASYPTSGRTCIAAYNDGARISAR